MNEDGAEDGVGLKVFYSSYKERMTLDRFDDFIVDLSMVIRMLRILKKYRPGLYRDLASE